MDAACPHNYFPDQTAHTHNHALPSPLMVLSSSLLPAHQQPKTNSLGITIVKRKKTSTICNIESTKKLEEKRGKL
jgi:hypothetical protein